MFTTIKGWLSDWLLIDNRHRLTAPPGTLHGDVWQIYINGKKPQKLDGSKNAYITVNYPPSYDMETVTAPSQPVENE